MIIIPMAGKSSRFVSAGFSKPKFMLDVWGRPLFDWSLLSFSNYSHTEKFVIVTRNDPAHLDYASQRMKELGYKNYVVVMLDKDTPGQAATVAKALQQVQPEANESLLIFNIDTIRLGYKYPEIAKEVDGYIEVAKLKGDHWSFVKPSGSNIVDYVEEKRRISDLCSTGIYYFKYASDYIKIYKNEIDKINDRSVWEKVDEQYIAPLYNAFIKNGCKIGYEEIEVGDVWLSGTPEEYYKIKSDVSFSKYSDQLYR